jgi:hypothetical protein
MSDGEVLDCRRQRAGAPRGLPPLTPPSDVTRLLSPLLQQTGAGGEEGAMAEVLDLGPGVCCGF